MVGDNGDESMNIGQNLSKEEVLDSIHVHILSSQILLNEKKGHGENKEVKQKVGSNDNSHELSECVEGNFGCQESFDGYCIRGDYSVGNLSSLATCSLRLSERYG